MHVHAMAEAYNVPVILHTDHAARKLLPWIDGMLDASENFMKERANLFTALTCLTFRKSQSKRISQPVVNISRE